jgi:hypothetical protein
MGEVIPDLMTLGHDAADDIFLTPDSVGNQEKRRACAVSAQLGQYEWCGCRIGAIIEGQRDEGCLESDPEKAAGIAGREPIEEPEWRAPEQDASARDRRNQQHQTEPPSPHRRSSPVRSSVTTPDRHRR